MAKWIVKAEHFAAFARVFKSIAVLPDRVRTVRTAWAFVHLLDKIEDTRAGAMLRLFADKPHLWPALVERYTPVFRGIDAADQATTALKDAIRGFDAETAAATYEALAKLASAEGRAVVFKADEVVEAGQAIAHAKQMQVAGNLHGGRVDEDLLGIDPESGHRIASCRRRRFPTSPEGLR